MVKIINDRYDLLEFKKSNTYDFTNYEVIIITFDFERFYDDCFFFNPCDCFMAPNCINNLDSNPRF